jgi:nitroimidazol reductase NimA-like FMN-containing flavoprotein (pyridoxamine 5'-phosphate oxidase superfamily)
MKSKRPQAPPFENTAEIEAFLSKPLLARFCSHNVDGSIHITPIFYLYENGEFLFGTQQMAKKVKNIERDPRVTVLIDAEEPVLQAVIVYGEASLDFENVLEKRVRILEKYYESPAAARAFAEKLARAWKTVIIHVQPTRMVTFDYSKPFTID